MRGFYLPVSSVVVLLLLAVTPESSYARMQDNHFLVLGVIASDKQRKGVALLKDEKSARTFAIREGETIADDVQLVEVQRRQVEVLIRGERHTIAVGQFSREAQRVQPVGISNMAALGGGMEVDGDVVRVSSIYRDHVINENLGQILMQAASEPYFNDGRLAGFTLWEIDQDSIFESLGLKDGDTILAINGQEINDVGSTIRTLHSLRSEPTATFSFMRDGKVREMTIQVQ